MSKQKTTHGGKRAGAGRKPSAEGAMVTISLRVPLALAAWLEDQAPDGKAGPMARELLESMHQVATAGTRAWIARERLREARPPLAARFTWVVWGGIDRRYHVGYFNGEVWIEDSAHDDVGAATIRAQFLNDAFIEGAAS